jgi:hypothetical protein
LAFLVDLGPIKNRGAYFEKLTSQNDLNMTLKGSFEVLVGELDTFGKCFLNRCHLLPVASFIWFLICAHFDFFGYADNSLGFIP